jgi:hypothetical protein
MARIRCVAQTAEIASGTAAKTLLQIVAPANQRLAVKGYAVSFDGIAGDAEPVVVDVLRQTTAGTMSALTPAKDDGLGTETIQSTAQHTATAEPTAGSILRSDNIHPQTGVEFRFAFDEELLVPGGGRLGLRVTAAANVNAFARFLYEE